MRWTPEQLAEYQARRGAPGASNTADVSDPPFHLPKAAGRYALGRLPTGTMNKLEKAYADHLEAKKTLGDVLWYRFEGLKLRLTDNTFYTPDFAVMVADGTIECHECKGFWQDDARVKIKVAASLYPFRFLAVKAIAKKHGGGWEREHF